VFKKGGAGHGPVEDMVDEAAIGIVWSTRHRG
jgi:hypothetical protein